MHQSQNFALQIGLEVMMDRDPSPQKPAMIERPLFTAYCTHPVPLSFTFAPLRFFNAGCAPDNLPGVCGLGSFPILLFKKSVIYAAVKEFILKLICQESSQNHGHQRHDFQLKMRQKAFSGRAPPGPAGGAYKGSYF